MPENLDARLTWPLPNVWLGVSVEDQATADERIPLLLKTPAVSRFVSYEPALGPVDFEPWLPQIPNGDITRASPIAPCGDRGLDQIIVGGESGPGARPFHVEWARSTVEECRAAGVACFVKQLGSNVHWNGISHPGGHWPDGMPRTACVEGWRVHLRDSKGGDMDEWPEDLRVRQFPVAR